MKALPKKVATEVESAVKAALHKSRNNMRKRRVKTDIFDWHQTDMDYSRAHGILEALEILDYGYFGPEEVDGVKDKKAKSKEQNLAWWFATMRTQVLEEEHFGIPSKKCEFCAREYGKG